MLMLALSVYLFTTVDLTGRICLSSRRDLRGKTREGRSALSHGEGIQSRGGCHGECRGAPQRRQAWCRRDTHGARERRRAQGSP